MGNYKNGFDKDFLTRTLEILDDLESKKFTPYNITLLLNCTLSLLCLPIQRTEDVKFSLSCVNELHILEVQLPTNIHPDTKGSKTLEQQIMYRIRNSFAHLHIETNKNIIDENIKTITIWNISENRKNFEITFTTKQLNIFCKYVATSYLKYLAA